MIDQRFHIYVFLEKDCLPSQKLVSHTSCLSPGLQSQLDFVPALTASGNRTALASDFSVRKTPTLVVANEIQPAEFTDEGGWCDLKEDAVETVEGADKIISFLNKFN